LLHDLPEYDLPVMHARLKDMPDPPQLIVALGKALEEADGIVLLSPEYNNSYSGALKNAVDYFTKEWAKKPIGITACSSGKMGGVNASNLMQLLVLGLGGYAMPRKWLVPDLAASLSEDGIPQNETVSRELQRFVEEMLWFTEAIAARKKV
jgi:NAD(P)H-dependent FMN reductase